MKATHILGIIGILLLILTLFLALSNFNASPSALQNATAGSISFRQSSTPTPTIEATSEIGSTDGILVMGVVIVLIVTLPLLFYKRK